MMRNGLLTPFSRLLTRNFSYYSIFLYKIACHLLLGVRDRIGEAVQPEEIYQIFIEKLETVLSKAVLEKAILESFSKKKSVMKRKKSELSGFFNNEKNRGHRKHQSCQAVEELDIVSNNVIPAPSPQFSFGFSFI